MKNIHVLPTDKSSKLFKHQLDEITLNISKHLLQRNYGFNIYITSDEEIKEGDYFIAYSVTIDKKPYISCASEYKERKKEKGKIILTTDQDLIKDGVQAIDDEFLEWFIKNQNCEEVEVNKLCYGALSGFSDAGYKIIIPKEEFSKDEIDKFFVDMVCNPKEEPKPFKQMEQLTEVDWEKFKKSPFPSKKVPKQETLEEAVYKFYPEDEQWTDRYVFKLGAKWQAERMYSEEEAKKLIVDFLFTKGIGREVGSVNEWFEQFKKK